jgi:hypothetical protein
MKLNFLIDIELFSQLDQNTINGIKVVTVISPCCCKVKNDKIIIFASALQWLMVFIPLDKESFFPNSAISLNYKWFIVLAANIHIKPLFYHQVVFF